jgi:hypothetical protein
VRAAVKLAVLPLALLAAAFASVTTRSAGAASPPADVTGIYDGKFLFKFYPLTVGDVPDRGSYPATMIVTLNDPMLSIILTIQTDAGPEGYNLQGRYGLGHFWAQGTGPSGQLALTGTVGGAAGRLRMAAAGGLVNPETVRTVKFNMKQQPPL